MAAQLLALRDIRLTFGGTPLLTGAALDVVPGDRIALVGRNGSGKSTLLKIAAGLAEPDHGERFAHPGALIRYLPQEADFTGFETALGYVEAALGPADDPHGARSMLNDLGLDGDEPTATLSGGEARRAALARVLVADPDVLLLDEPTNHLDLPAIEWLEKTLARLKSAIVVISHDRRFLETLSRATVWLERGTTRRLEKGFAAFEAWRDELIEKEETDRHKLDRKIAREEQWMHGGVTARRKRNMRRVSELDAMRKRRREERRRLGNVKLESAEGELSGRLVIEATNLDKSYDGKPVVAGLSIRILRGDRLGLVGPNGAGKTTLLKLLTGTLAPDSGTLRLGTNLEMVTLDQRRDELNPGWTVADSLTGGRGDQVVINGKARHVASYMKDFLFQPEQARSPVSILSGGERGRLMLARALAKPSNLLVLDEPTNDLDLETLDLLQELLADYSGTLLLVSHDRDFLDRVVTSTIVSDGNGRWIEYAGGYSDMLAQRGRSEPSSPTGRAASAQRAPAETGTPPIPPSRPPKRKLSFKESHALKTLPATIAKLEADIATLEAELAGPDLYAKDPAAFTAASERLAAAQSALAAAEEQWLELELMRAALEE